MSTFDAARYRETERQVYSQKALSYEKYGAPIFEALAAPLLEAARLERGQRVLDIACGLGIPSLTAATMVAPRGSVMGVDLAPGMIDLARVRADRMGLSNVSFEEADAERLPFPNESFDVVLCHQGLVHFTDRSMALQEMHRVLKPGGRVAVSVWSTPDHTVVIGIVARTVRELWPAAVVPGAPTWFDFGPEGAIETALVAAGFRSIQTFRYDLPLEVPDGETYWRTNLGISGRLEMLLQTVPQEVSRRIESTAKSEAEKWRQGAKLRIPCEEVIATAVK